jgi:hypothetical protein
MPDAVPLPVPAPVRRRSEAAATVRQLELVAARLMAGATPANASERRHIGQLIWQLVDLVQRAEQAGRLFGREEG